MCFAHAFSTVLKGNAHEPVYLPAQNLSADKPERMHTIFYRDDYFSSALHEVAHWCIAGEQRRLIEDYGYWYEPDGRNAAKQKAFQQVEVKPQAIEMAFSIACGKPFRVSIDNLGESCGQQDTLNQANFEKAVNQQFQIYTRQGFPSRAAIFIHAIKNAFSDRTTATNGCETKSENSAFQGSNTI